MVKRILAVLAGVIAGVALVQATDMLSGKLYPPPAGIDFNNKEALKEMISNMPTNAFVLHLIGYAIASFVGGLVATLVADNNEPRAAMITGGVLMVAGIMNVMSLPGHPVWFIVASTLAYVPAAYVGYLLARKKGAAA